MITNARLTLYHKRYNLNKRLDEYDIYPIENVMWQGGKGASVDKGFKESNDIKIFIPYNQNEELENVPFSIGDIVVKGIIEQKIEKQSDLKEDNFKITTIINNVDYDEDMNHLYIGAK